MSVTGAVGSLLVLHFALMIAVPSIYLFRHRHGYMQRGIALASYILSWIFQGSWTGALIVPAFLAGGLAPGPALYAISVAWVLLGAVVCYPFLVWLLGLMRARAES